MMTRPAILAPGPATPNATPRPRWILSLLAALTLAALPLPATAQEVGGSNAELAREAFNELFNRQPPARFTATRADLAAAGVTFPLIRGELGEGARTVSAGFFKNGTLRDLTIWRAQDTATFFTDPAGILRSTMGLGEDLHAAETAPVAPALARAEKGQSPAPYRRIYRFTDDAGTLRLVPFDCAVTSLGRAEITILGRGHRTLVTQETCRGRDAHLSQDLEITNTYWRDPGDGTMWRSRQWISNEGGYLRLDRVIR